MRVEKTNRGFKVLVAPNYPKGEDAALVQQSSVIGDYDDAFQRPGTSALWIGEHFHLYREDVERLVSVLAGWLETGDLSCKNE